MIVGLVTWPLIFVGGGFSGDWPTHLWFVWHQGEALLHDPRPSLFVHYDDGVFYPHFAFYGGTLYTVVGGLSAVLGGSGRNAYVLSWILAFAAAHGGWTWLGRMAGLGRWWAQLPGVLFVTSPYLLTTTYVRGDWPELVAVCSIPLLIAASISVLRADRLALLPGLALAVSAIVFSGSHNLTLLWGTTFLAVLGGALSAAVPAARRLVTRRGLLRVASVVVPAVLVNAWYLLPDLAYQAHTVISAQYGNWRYLLEARMDLVSSAHLFALDRPSALPAAAEFVLTLPVLAMGWAAIAGGLTLPRSFGATWARILVVSAVTAAALIVLMTHAGLVLALPRPYVMIQFTYRLESYVLVAITGAVLAALVLLRDAPHRIGRWTWVLVPVLAVWVIGGIGQTAGHPDGGRVSSFLRPTIGSMGIFGDAGVPEVAPARLAKISFPPERVSHDRITVTASAAPGQVVDTNLMTMPALVTIEGATLIGDHTTQHDGDVRRHAVLRIDEDATPGAARITIHAAHPAAVTIGRVLSLLGILGLVVSLARPAVRRRRGSTEAVRAP
ncbi:MAG TPA: hypothetical protein VGO71_21005 [Baekduia sp.]|nr:hypothetical protein [Baekduia sp.]